MSTETIYIYTRIRPFIQNTKLTFWQKQSEALWQMGCKEKSDLISLEMS